MGGSYRWAAEGEFTVVQHLASQHVTSNAPIYGTAIDTRSYPGQRILAICSVDARTSHGVTFAVQECADATTPAMPLAPQSDGWGTAANTDGSLAKLSAAGQEVMAILPNPNKPWIRLSMTGDTASMDLYAGATLLFFDVP